MVLICDKREAFALVRACERVRSANDCDDCALRDFCDKGWPDEMIEIKEEE